MGSSTLELFASRNRIRRWKAAAGIVHLVTLASLVFCLLWALPHFGAKNAFELGQEAKEHQDSRQLLLEAMDKFARYEGYFHEANGHYTRDLSRLNLPVQLSTGSEEDLLRDYEISVLEIRPNGFLLLATGVHSSDRLTIDEIHRVNANFVLPPPSRAFLTEEADRLLRLRIEGVEPGEGLYARYWKLAPEEGTQWVAVGLRGPVLNEKRALEPESSSRGLASLFTAVSSQVKNHLGPQEGEAFNPPVDETEAALPVGSPREVLNSRDATEWLQAAQLAQTAYRRELGHFASRWEDLDHVSSYRFGERMRLVKNLRVHPIEFNVAPAKYRLTLEGTSGDLMGEQFVMDDQGGVRQVRYTEALIQQLQTGTSLLENFQINPIVDDPMQKRRP